VGWYTNKNHQISMGPIERSEVGKKALLLGQGGAGKTSRPRQRREVENTGEVISTGKKKKVSFGKRKK